ncbi:MAG: sugar transferase [Patescibacteria group bacterium]|nr:sugar transferase [Patescibacteria group bacterium]
MTLKGSREAVLLFVGDVAIFYLSLWLTLLIRYGALPRAELWWGHFLPFSIIFLFWVLSFFIFDLYRRPRLLFRDRLPRVIINTQVLNSLLAVLFFYFIPYFSVTPKTNLFINLALSLCLILLWRLFLSQKLAPAGVERFVFAVGGQEVGEIEEILRASKSVKITDWEVWKASARDPFATTIVIGEGDATSPEQLRDFYPLVFAGVQFVNVHRLYETLLGRVPISLIDHSWFLANISNRPKVGYGFLKRGTDVVLSLVLGVISLVFYPFIALCIKLQDGGPVFFLDERVGRSGKVFVVGKFRSMSLEPGLDDRRVTKLGRFLRQTRLDELPQLWSVLKGDMSFVGPRPERPEYVALYRKEIPYYNTRHLVAPGLSGWAQIYQANHPHFQAQLDATREKLSYDLFYLKNRGWWLDVKIALKTIRALLSRSGI